MPNFKEETPHSGQAGSNSAMSSSRELNRSSSHQTLRSSQQIAFDDARVKAKLEDDIKLAKERIAILIAEFNTAKGNLLKSIGAEEAILADKLLEKAEDGDHAYNTDSLIELINSIKTLKKNLPSEIELTYLENYSNSEKLTQKISSILEAEAKADPKKFLRTSTANRTFLTETNQEVDRILNKFKTYESKLKNLDKTVLKKYESSAPIGRAVPIAAEEPAAPTSLWNGFKAGLKDFWKSPKAKMKEYWEDLSWKNRRKATFARTVLTGLTGISLGLTIVGAVVGTGGGALIPLIVGAAAFGALGVVVALSKSYRQNKEERKLLKQNEDFKNNCGQKQDALIEHAKRQYIQLTNHLMKLDATANPMQAITIKQSATRLLATLKGMNSLDKDKIQIETLIKNTQELINDSKLVDAPLLINSNILTDEQQAQLKIEKVKPAVEEAKSMPIGQIVKERILNPTGLYSGANGLSTALTLAPQALTWAGITGTVAVAATTAGAGVLLTGVTWAAERGISYEQDKAIATLTNQVDKLAEYSQRLDTLNTQMLLGSQGTKQNQVIIEQEQQLAELNVKLQTTQNLEAERLKAKETKKATKAQLIAKLEKENEELRRQLAKTTTTTTLFKEFDIHETPKTESDLNIVETQTSSNKDHPVQGGQQHSLEVTQNEPKNHLENPRP